MKKALSLLLVFTLVLSLCACGGSPSSAGGGTPAPAASGSTPAASGTDADAATGQPLEIMMYVIQSLGTLSCEDLIYDEVVRFCEETGSKLTTYECNSDASAHETSLKEIAGSGKYDVIITGYWSIPEFVQMTAELYPEQKWLIFDTEIDYSPEHTKNIASFTAEQNTLAFMAGVLAALMTESGVDDGIINADKKVGFVGGGENTAINDFLVGYIDGVNYVDSSIEVLYSYVGNWDDTAKCKELALTQYNSGADVSFAVCGAAGFGLCEAAAQVGGYAFGVDTDYGATLELSNPATADYVVTSAIKQFGVIMYDALVALYDGSLEMGQHYNYGVESGYLELIETEQFDKIVKTGMPEVYEEYTKIVEELKAGNIEVGTAVGADEAYINGKKAEAAAF